MNIPRVLVPIIFASMLFGCAQPSRLAETDQAKSKLVIYDLAENVLAEDDIPVRGWSPIDVVMREGTYDAAIGIFVKMNGTVRFLPWVDLVANPLGQRVFSDNFVKAGELTLRVTKAPCGGRIPLVFQIRELRPPVEQAEAAETLDLSKIGYEPISDWAETGLYLPNDLADHIDARWAEQDCQPALSTEAAMYVQQTLVPSSGVLPAGASSTEWAKQPTVDNRTKKGAARPCRLCRDSDDHGDNGYSGGGQHEGGGHR